MQTVEVFIPCPSDITGILEMIRKARAAGLAASYAPHGGARREGYTPITHRLLLVGRQDRVEAFITNA